MGRAGEALLFLLPSEREFVDSLEATGTHVQEADLLPLLEALPAAGPLQASCWHDATRMRVRAPCQLEGVGLSRG